MEGEGQVNRRMEALLCKGIYPVVGSWVTREAGGKDSGLIAYPLVSGIHILLQAILWAPQSAASRIAVER